MNKTDQMEDSTKLEAVVEYSGKNFCAYVRGVDGIIGFGDDFKSVKESLEKSIELHKDLCEGLCIKLEHEFLCDYKLTYKYDLSSFLNIYEKILINLCIESITYINQEQRLHNKIGMESSRRKSVEKVQGAIHMLANELTDIEFSV